MQVPLFGTLQTITRFHLRIAGTPDNYCGSLLLDYDVINGVNGASPDRFTSSRLWRCPVGATCDLLDAEQIWDFETIPVFANNPPLAFVVSDSPIINGGVITAADIPGTEVLLLGNVVYNGNNWINNTRSRVIMGPGATLSFGNNVSPPQNITVTNASFYPCADQAFNTISVGPNSAVTMIDNPNVVGANADNSIIYGANTGVTVQNGGSFTANGIIIDGCIIGVSTNRAALLNLNNIQISYEGLQPNGSRYAIDPEDVGFIGVSVSGANLRFGQVHALNNVLIQDQSIGVQILGSWGGIGQPYRQARVGISGGSIIDVEVGVLNRFNNNGFLVTTGLNIDAAKNGIVTQGSFGSLVSLTGGTINADQTGVELSYSGNTFMFAQNMEINNTEQFGMRAFQSPNSTVNFTGNTITIPTDAPDLATAASINGNVNGQTVVSGNTITTLSPDAVGVSAVGNQNNGGGFRQNVTINNNDVAVGGTSSTGINIEDNSRGNIGCNQVSNLIGGAGPIIAGAVGMISNTNNRFGYSCNYLGEVEYGLAIVGVNDNARNSRFAFHGNDWGLTVGFDVGPFSSTFDEIGENMEFPAIEYQGFIPNDTWHFADQSMYPTNQVIARDDDPLYTPVTGDFLNWFNLLPNNAPAANCGNCLGIPPVWPIDDDCPPSTEVTQSEWTNLYKTRILEKAATDYPDDCDIPSNCYTPLAQAEVTFENLISNDYFNPETAVQLESLIEEFSENGLSTEELDQLVSLSETLNSQDADETGLNNSLSSLRNSLDDVPTCSQEGTVWKESLDLSIKSYLPEGLSVEETQQLVSTAMECSTLKGPGVYLARRTLGLASNDANSCIVGGDTENLVIRSEKIDAEFEIFPSPAKAGSLITTRTDITSEVILTSASSATMLTLTRIRDRSFKLPIDLLSGVFIVSYQSGDEVITTKIQVID